MDNNGSVEAGKGTHTAGKFIGDLYGNAKFFVASDHVVSDSYRVFTATDVYDLAVRHGLHFSQTRQTGVVFHMLTALGEHGRLGLTAVADTHGEARRLYDRALHVLGLERAKYQERV